MKTAPIQIDLIWINQISDNGEDEVAKDIAESIVEGDELSWCSPLRALSGAYDRWAENHGYSDEYINELMYDEIRVEDNRRFEMEWDEKMKRQRDGIE